MGRANYQFREGAPNRKTLHPAWRGVGFIILVALTIGGFWLAGYLLELNWADPFLPFRVPQRFTLTIVDWLPPLPGKLVVQVVSTVLIDIVAFSIMVILYAFFFPIRPGATDAPQPRGRRRRSMVR